MKNHIDAFNAACDALSQTVHTVTDGVITKKPIENYTKNVEDVTRAITALSSASASLPEKEFNAIAGQIKIAKGHAKVLGVSDETRANLKNAQTAFLNLKPELMAS